MRKPIRARLTLLRGGVGTSPHLSGEFLKTMAGVNLVHVPYRGTALALADLLAGQVQVVFDNIPGSIGHIKTGRVAALGVTAPKRVAAIPDVPTIGGLSPVWANGSGPRLRTIQVSSNGVTE